MAVAREDIRRIAVVGANHRSSSAMVRDKLMPGVERLPLLFDRLLKAGLRPAIPVAADDRVEIILVAPQGGSASHDLRSEVARVFAEAAGVDVWDIVGFFFVFREREAVEHVFSVASALDGLVCGDMALPRRLEEGYRLALDVQASSPVLDALMDAARGAASRVRMETRLSARPASLVDAAVARARDVHGDLSACHGLVLGSNRSGMLFAARLREAGVGDFTIITEKAQSAEAAASSLHGRHWPPEELEKALAVSDIVVTAAGGGARHIRAPVLRSLMRRRGHRPMLLIDASVPGDVEPACGALDGVFLFDLNDFEQMVMDADAGDATMRARARAILHKEAEAFLRGEEASPHRRLEAGDMLRRHCLGVREVLLRDNRNLNVEDATRLLLENLMGPVMKHLKSIPSDAARQQEMSRLLAVLFDMEEAPAADADTRAAAAATAATAAAVVAPVVAPVAAVAAAEGGAVAAAVTSAKGAAATAAASGGAKPSASAGREKKAARASRGEARQGS